jgi:signal transduction histidine kinase
LLRRDLHDGLGPVLASATMRADVARTMVATDPDAATQMLMQLRDDLRMAVSDVRRLARQLELQTLDGVGLGSALRKQARRFEQAGGGRLRITVAGPPQHVTLPNSVEVALYRIASEALTNVVRHAAARHCAVRLSVDEAIRLEIVDDGVGLPSRVSEGVGFDSMRERAREFGGDCKVMPSRPRGTRVLASLPLRRSA